MLDLDAIAVRLATLQSQADAAFLTDAQETLLYTDVPALTAEVRRLRTDNEMLRAIRFPCMEPTAWLLDKDAPGGRVELRNVTPFGASVATFVR